MAWDHGGCRTPTLAHAAEQIDAPGRRGRGGLMTPLVTQLVEETHGMSVKSCDVVYDG